MYEYIKKTRRDNQERFETLWLDTFEERYNMVLRENGSYTIDESKYGTVDYWPKKDKVLVRKNNRWINNGLKWLVYNLLPKKEREKL